MILLFLSIENTCGITCRKILFLHLTSILMILWRVTLIRLAADGNINIMNGLLYRTMIININQPLQNINADLVQRKYHRRKAMSILVRHAYWPESKCIYRHAVLTRIKVHIFNALSHWAEVEPVAKVCHNYTAACRPLVLTSIPPVAFQRWLNYIFHSSIYTVWCFNWLPWIILN